MARDREEIGGVPSGRIVRSIARHHMEWNEFQMSQHRLLTRVRVLNFWRSDHIRVTYDADNGQAVFVLLGRTPPRPQPPAWGHGILSWIYSNEQTDALLGDLEEQFTRKVEQLGIRRARLWHLKWVTKAVVAFAWAKLTPIFAELLKRN